MSMPWGGRDTVTLRQLLPERLGGEQRPAQRLKKLLHSHIRAVIIPRSMTSFIHTLNQRLQSPHYISLSELADHDLQNSGLTRCSGSRTMGSMLLKEHKLVVVKRASLEMMLAWSLWASLGTMATVPIKSCTTTRKSVPQNLGPLCHQLLELR